jgi:hypothetical protein
MSVVRRLDRAGRGQQGQGRCWPEKIAATRVTTECEDEHADGELDIRGPMTISGEKVLVACEAQQSGPRTREKALYYEVVFDKNAPKQE